MVFKLFVVGVAFAIAFLSCVDEANAAVNCGIKCFRWQKCMNQINGHETRPGQLGNTGQIVLNTCDLGECDCDKVAETAKEQRANKAKEALAEASHIPKSSSDLRRPPRLVRNKHLSAAPVVTVSTSVSSSSSVASEESGSTKLTLSRLRLLRRKLQNQSTH